jgi:hypothetical protein
MCSVTNPAVHLGHLLPQELRYGEAEGVDTPEAGGVLQASPVGTGMCRGEARLAISPAPLPADRKTVEDCHSFVHETYASTDLKRMAVLTTRKALRLASCTLSLHGATVPGGESPFVASELLVCSPSSTLPFLLPWRLFMEPRPFAELWPPLPA